MIAVVRLRRQLGDRQEGLGQQAFDDPFRQSLRAFVGVYVQELVLSRGPKLMEYRLGQMWTLDLFGM